MYVCMYVCMCMYVYTCVCVCVCMYVYVICMSMYHMYILRHINHEISLPYYPK